jgi:hypothetical protein
MTGVRLQIISSESVLLDDGSDDNLIVPLGVSERIIAFRALTNALALLAGLMPPASDSEAEDARLGPF